MTLFLSWNTQGDIYCRLYNKHAMKVNSDHGTTFLVNNFNFGLFLEQRYHFDNSYAYFLYTFIVLFCLLEFWLPFTLNLLNRSVNIHQNYIFMVLFMDYYFFFFLPFLEFWLPFTLNHMDNSYGLFFLWCFVCHFWSFGHHPLSMNGRE